jgi:UDP-glucose 4-epimerase
MKKRILITGGTGYIGSHTAVELINAGFEVVIIDDLSNSSIDILDRIEKIAGVKPDFHELDLTDRERFFRTMETIKPIHAVIHFAASKAVAESVEKPLLYYRNNLLSLIHVLEAMQRFQISNLVFSSSSTVYGEPDNLPVTEQTPFKPAESPYGNTKQICEEIIRDTCNADTRLRAISLRYFNPAGAHESALIGERPKGKPNNLMPYITQAAIGIRPELSVFGDDYETPDGSAIRDYVHVTDLAQAHLAALNRILGNNSKNPYEFFNVGTGKGFSVFEIIDCFEAVNNVRVPFKITDRRMGDVESIYADTSTANSELKWTAEKTLEDMVRSAWNWQLTLMDEHVNKTINITPRK